MDVLGKIIWDRPCDLTAETILICLLVFPCQFLSQNYTNVANNAMCISKKRRLKDLQTAHNIRAAFFPVKSTCDDERYELGSVKMRVNAIRPSNHVVETRVEVNPCSRLWLELATVLPQVPNCKFKLLFIVFDANAHIKLVFSFLSTTLKFWRIWANPAVLKTQIMLSSAHLLIILKRKKTNFNFPIFYSFVSKDLFLLKIESIDSLPSDKRMSLNRIAAFLSLVGLRHTVVNITCKSLSSHNFQRLPNVNSKYTEV